MTPCIPPSLTHLRCASVSGFTFSKGPRTMLPSRTQRLGARNRLGPLVGSGEDDHTVGAEGTWPLVRGARLETSTRSHWRAGQPIAADRGPLSRAVSARMLSWSRAARSSSYEPAPLESREPRAAGRTWTSGIPGAACAHFECLRLSSEGFAARVCEDLPESAG